MRNSGILANKFNRFLLKSIQCDLSVNNISLCLPRCIKPNDKKASHIFTDSLVCHQVRYLGLMENVRVRRAGYAFRQAYEPCLERYKMLCKRTWPHWRGPA
ncbi:hypothetical protein KUCAC02_010354, partial [Chaenocephalus aceratus]